MLERLVARVRDRANKRLYRVLSSLVDEYQRASLQQLLETETGTRQTTLDRLRKAPTRISGAELVRALNRLRKARSLGANQLDVSGVPSGRIAALARMAMSVKAQSISRMPEQRRIATLVAFARALEARAQDDVLDLFDRLVADLVSRSRGENRRERFRTIKDLDAAAPTARDALEVLLGFYVDDARTLGEARHFLFSTIGVEELEGALDIIEKVARPPAEDHQKELRQTLSGMLPQVDLPELLLEMHERTGFASEFTHVGEGAIVSRISPRASAPSSSPRPAT